MTWSNVECDPECTDPQLEICEPIEGVPSLVPWLASVLSTWATARARTTVNSTKTPTALSPLLGSR
jgi:hypothetical protein